MLQAPGHGCGNEPALAAKADYLVGVAARAPSVHNTQPWRFKVGDHAVELFADASRQLRQDLAGREMLISCGAALFGLRLAVRSLGYLAEVELFPEPAVPLLLARVRPGRWVFADLQTQPLLTTSIRALIQTSLALPGPPQMLLGLGVARVTRPTARRPAEKLTEA